MPIYGNLEKAKGEGKFKVETGTGTGPDTDTTVTSGAAGTVSTSYDPDLSVADAGILEVTGVNDLLAITDVEATPSGANLTLSNNSASNITVASGSVTTKYLALGQ